MFNCLVTFCVMEEPDDDELADTTKVVKCLLKSVARSSQWMQNVVCAEQNMRQINYDAYALFGLLATSMPLLPTLDQPFFNRVQKSKFKTQNLKHRCIAAASAEIPHWR